MENILQIYHGSQDIIDTPEYGKGKSTNDYGKGFYCTENIELAKEWACSRNEDGYANAYELDMEGLEILQLNSQPYNVLHWLAILADNRTYWERNSISENAKRYLRDNFLIDISGYDVIIGYRADDSYFTFAKNFVSNAISLKQLQRAMKLGELGEQVVLKSRKAFNHLKFLGAEVAPSSVYYYKKVARDDGARTEYRRQARNGPDQNDILMIDIMREGMKHDDPRLL